MSDDALKLRTPGVAATAVVFVVAVLFMVIGMHPMLSLYDEGIVLVGAERVLQGELPYRDFWALYAPAQFHVVAWLFSLFGVNDLTLRLYGIVVKAAITVLVHVLLVRSVRPAYAWLATVAVLFLLTGTHNYGFPVFPALALCLLAVVLLQPGPAASGRLFVAGLCVGAGALFRQDLGAYATVALLLGVVLASPAGTSRVRGCAWLLAGIVAVLLPVCGRLLTQVSAADLFDQLLHFPLTIYPDARGLPWPWPWSAGDDGATSTPASLARYAVYVPFVVTVLIVVLELTRRPAPEALAQARENVQRERWLLVVLVIMNLLFTIKGWVRSEPLHMVQSLLLSILLIAMILARERSSASPTATRRARLAPVVLAVLILPPPVLFGPNAVAKSLAEFVHGGDHLWARCSNPALPRLRCAKVDADSLQTVRYLIDHSGRDDRIYVGAARHDRFVVNALAFYFLADRAPATRWHELHPGLQTSAPIQQAMIDEFTRRPPRLVVLSLIGQDRDEPNASSRSSGVRLFDDFLDARYAEVARFGVHRVLAPR